MDTYALVCHTSPDRAMSFSASKSGASSTTDFFSHISTTESRRRNASSRRKTPDLIAIINGAIGARSDEWPSAMYRIVIINERDVRVSAYSPKANAWLWLHYYRRVTVIHSTRYRSFALERVPPAEGAPCIQVCIGECIDKRGLALSAKWFLTRGSNCRNTSISDQKTLDYAVKRFLKAAHCCIDSLEILYQNLSGHKRFCQNSIWEGMYNFFLNIHIIWYSL